MGPVGSNGTLSQTIATGPGSYEVDFWFQPDGGVPSFFSASFGGTTLFSVTNPAASAYTFHSVLTTAASSNPVLSFSFRPR